MSKIMPAIPSISRKSGFIKPKVEVVIACEGTITEPDYFNKCIQAYGAGLVRLRVLPISGVPMTVVNAAIEERESLLEKRRKSPDSFDAFFSVWAVFDRDLHPDVDQAINLAIKNTIGLAFSDPCFELWPLLHLVDCGAKDERHIIQKRLASEMPNYDHKTNARIDFELIKDRIELAIDRASIHLSNRENEGVPLGRPSTTVGNLVQKIRENGRMYYSSDR